MTIQIRLWHALVLLAVSGARYWYWQHRRVALLCRGGDELWLTIPAAWNEKFDSPQKIMPAGVWLTPRQGPPFNVLITSPFRHRRRCRYVR